MVSSVWLQATSPASSSAVFLINHCSQVSLPVFSENPHPQPYSHESSLCRTFSITLFDLIQYHLKHTLCENPEKLSLLEFQLHGEAFSQGGLAMCNLSFFDLTALTF